MPNFEGLKDYPIERFASYVDWDDPTTYPLGIQVLAQNMRYFPEGVGTRLGTKTTITAGGAINGLACLNYHGTSDITYPLVFDSAGSLKKESPEGSGTLVPITPSIGSFTAGSYMQAVAAYGREWMAFSDLKTTKYGNFVLDGKTGILDPISTAPNAVAASMVSSATVGHICAGARNAVVLFQTRNGYISGGTIAAIFSYTVPAAGFKIALSGIPLGPANTIARIIAFTVANDGTAGSYFYIPEATTISGIAIDATVINDNVSTTATFDFLDTYLEKSVDVSDFTLPIQIPAAKNIYFSRSLRKMVYVAPAGFETGYLISDTDDPEHCTGDTSFMAPGTTNDVPMGWAELRGVQYALKSSSGHLVNPSADNPVLWQSVETWAGTGPCGVRAWDVSTPSDQDQQAFIVYAHKSGMYVMTGTDPTPVTKFFKNVWDRINWTYQHLIAVSIDEGAREIHVCVPLDGSTVNNKVLTFNYLFGFQDPMIFSHYVKKWLPNPQGIKLSIDSYPPGINQVCVFQRNLATPVSPQIDSRQVLFAGQDGKIRMSVPDTSYVDDTNGIDSQLQTAFAKEDDLAILGFGGIKVKARGNKSMYLTPMVPGGAYGTRVYSQDLSKTGGNAFRFDIQTRGEADHFGWLLTNGYVAGTPTKNAGAYFEVLSLSIMARRKWRAKRG